MFKQLLRKYRKPPGRDVQQLPYPYVEREEDEFVLIGETEIERTTHYPANYKETSPISYFHHPPTPPAYQDIYKDSFSAADWYLKMGQKPSNQKIVKQTGDLCTVDSSSPNGHSPRVINVAEADTQNTALSGSVLPSRPADSDEMECAPSHRSALHDVPFKLSEHLQVLSSCNRQNSQQVHIATSMPNFEYNFTLERAVMKEFKDSIE